MKPLKIALFVIVLSTPVLLLLEAGVAKSVKSFAEERNARGKYLQLQFTVEDKNVFTTPWSATMTYRSGGDGPTDWNELTCAENRAWYPGKDMDVPTAARPDF